MGAYAKSGAAPISGLIKPGDIPPRGGLYLLDVVPDGEVRFGFPNINDNAEIAELIACGSHAVLFVTGRGSVVGSAISPVVKICANPETYRRMADDMDVDAGRIMEGAATLDEVGREIRDVVVGLGAWPAHEIRGTGAPGVHPDLQELRADRAGLPAGRLRTPMPMLSDRLAGLLYRGRARRHARHGTSRLHPCRRNCGRSFPNSRLQDPPSPSKGMSFLARTRTRRCSPGRGYCHRRRRARSGFASRTTASSPIWANCPPRR